MNTIETIIDDYISEYGTSQEKEVHEIYKGKYLQMFSRDDTDLEESVEFGGSEVFIFGALVFILETVGKSIIQDGYKLSKERILGYIKKDKNKIPKKVVSKELALTNETIEKLISLLESELENRKIEEEKP